MMLLYQDQIFSRNKILSEKIGPKDWKFQDQNFQWRTKIFKKNWSGGPKISVKKLIQGPKFSGPKFQ